jgi:hypothetical protein
VSASGGLFSGMADILLFDRGSRRALIVSESCRRQDERNDPIAPRAQ